MRVFKHFQDSDHAKALTEGTVWLSTLEHCRRCEDRLRGDKAEGKITLGSGVIGGTLEDPSVARFASMAGFKLGRDVRVNFHNCFATRTMENAYLVSTALAPYSDEQLLMEFGRHCVQISDVDLFYHRVTKALERTIGLLKLGNRNHVTYSDPYFEGLAPAPGELGFVKSPSIFGPQNEFRFLWIVNDDHTYKDFGLHVPQVAELCKVVPTGSQD